MRRQEVQAIGDVLVEYLRESGLEKPLLERQIVASWGELMGQNVAQLTRSVELENGVLRVKLRSAGLKAQLFECRRELIKKMNDFVGSEVVTELRLS